MKLEKKLADILYDQYLRILIIVLESEELDLERAKTITKEFLDLVNNAQTETVEKQIATFVAKNPLFESILTTVKSYEDEKRTAQVLEKMRIHLKNNNVDNALKVATDHIGEKNG